MAAMKEISSWTALLCHPHAIRLLGAKSPMALWSIGRLVCQFFFGNLISDIIIHGDTMFHGDTMGIHISIAWIVGPLSLVAVMLIYFVIKADIRAEEQYVPWSAKNTKLMIMILGFLPIQAVLFAIGEPQGLTDQIGVIMSITQCYLIPLFLRPYSLNNQKASVSVAH